MEFQRAYRAQNGPKHPEWPRKLRIPRMSGMAWSRLPYSNDPYFHDFAFVIVSCVSWQISKLQIWSTAGRSATAKKTTKGPEWLSSWEGLGILNLVPADWLSGNGPSLIGCRGSAAWSSSKQQLPPHSGWMTLGHSAHPDLFIQLGVCICVSIFICILQGVFYWFRQPVSKFWYLELFGRNQS